MVAPSSEARESITCVSAFWQKGQRTSVSLVYATLRVARALGRAGQRAGLRAAGRPARRQRHATPVSTATRTRSRQSAEARIPGAGHGAKVYAAVRTRHPPRPGSAVDREALRQQAHLAADLVGRC